jgi:hypothetical protein
MTRRDKKTYAVAGIISLASFLLFALSLGTPGRAVGGSSSASGEADAILPVLTDPTSVDPARYQVLADRPLFVSDRHPVPLAAGAAAAEKPAATVVSTTSLSLALLGTMLRGSYQAILAKHVNSTEFFLLRQGQSIDGWTLEEVRRDGAVFQSGDTQQTLTLPDSGKDGPLDK